MSKDFPDVSQVVHFSTNEMGTCKDCPEPLSMGSFADAINHYIQKHGYKLLHVGTETDRNSDEGTVRLWYSTAAILGK